MINDLVGDYGCGGGVNDEDDVKDDHCDDDYDGDGDGDDDYNHNSHGSDEIGTFNYCVVLKLEALFFSFLLVLLIDVTWVHKQKGFLRKHRIVPTAPHFTEDFRSAFCVLK